MKVHRLSLLVLVLVFSFVSLGFARSPQWDSRPEKISALIRNLSSVIQPGVYVGMTPKHHDCLVEIYFSPSTSIGGEARLSIISHSHYYHRQLGAWSEQTENVIIRSGTEFAAEKFTPHFVHIVSRLQNQTSTLMEAKLWIDHHHVVRGEFSGLPVDNSTPLVCEAMAWTGPASDD